MELRQLRYFMQISKDGSFSKAAKSLYISQQGLSKAIAALEQELGVVLLYRDKRAVVLTEAGEYLQKQAAAILKEVEKTEKRMSTFNDHGPVRLAFAYAVMGELPDRMLSQWEERHPQIQIEITEHPDLFVEEAIVNEEADIGFSIGPINEQLFESHYIKHRRLCLLINKKNPLSKRKALSCKDLQGERIISVNHTFKTYSNFVTACHREGVEPNIVYLGAEISIIHNMSRQGKGIGITVDFIADSMDSTKYECVPFEEDEMNWDIYLIIKKGRKLTFSAQMLKKYILELYQAQ